MEINFVPQVFGGFTGVPFILMARHLYRWNPYVFLDTQNVA